MVSITFPDGSTKDFDDNVTGLQVAESISEGLARAAVAITVNGTTLDLTRPITSDAAITILTFKDDKGKEVYWHSSAHVLAMAVKRIWPETKLTIGPPIENGFYYDFDIDRTFSQEDLAKIEDEMKKIIKEDIPFERQEVTAQKAKELFKDNPYKLEIIDEYQDSALSIYSNGDFIDLCRGPHLPSTGKVKSVKITNTSAAYWRGNAQNASLQRIYAISFPDKKELNQYLQRLEEAAKRDHRKIAKDLDLAMFHEWSPGAPYFLPNGTIIYNELVDFIREEYRKRGYEEVITPQLFNQKLWEQSGHWEHYREDMFIIEIEGEQHSLKPMNCPSHCLIFNRKSRSYRDLPIRIADFCNLHRNELSGTLAGMTRVRKFAQDDAHIFCRLDQVEEEVLGVLQFIKDVWEGVFDFKLTYYLSTRPEKALGDKAIWDKAEAMLKAALEKAKIPYEVKDGDGAFYGPKIDIDLEDALGRKWQCPTCQLDFNLPHRFENMYEGEDGKKHECVMIHRAVLGSLERFMAMLIEHYAGKFPLWLSPEQVRVLPISDRHMDYAQQVVDELKRSGLRVKVDEKSLTINKKVRNAQVDNVNYIVVVGDAEEKASTVNVRTRDNIVHGEVKIDEFTKKLVKECESKAVSSTY